MKKWLNYSLFLYFLTLPSWVLAEEPYRLEFVYTPSRIEEPLEAVTSSVTVITQEDIKKRQANTVYEVLRAVPGLRVESLGTFGEEVNVRLRGAEFDQVLVLVDGVEVNSPLTGEYDFGDLAIDNIERIEIVRGAQSPLYGSEAMGGVIHIITRKGKGLPSYSFLSEAGNQETSKGLFSTNGEWGKFNYSLSASMLGTGGQFRRDNFNAPTLSGRFGFSINDRSSVEFISRFVNSWKDLAISPATFLSPRPRLLLAMDGNRELERETGIHTLIFQGKFFDWWNFRFQGSLVNSGIDDENPSDPSAPFISLTDFVDLDSSRFTLHTQHDFQVSPFDTFTLGLEYEGEKVELDEYGNLESIGLGPLGHVKVHRSRDNFAFYVQNQFQWERRLFLSAGIRMDQNSRFGNHINPKFSFAYRFPSIQTKFKGSVGTGFRAPSFLELYLPSPGNADLDPEESTNFDLGIEQGLWDQKISLGITYFYIRFSDLIGFHIPSFRMMNFGKATSQGIEMELGINPMDDLHLGLNYTYLDTEDENKGKELPRRPRNSFNFNVSYSLWERWLINLDTEVISSQSNSAPGIIDLDGKLLGNRNSGFTRLNLSLTYALPEKRRFLNNGQIFGRIVNLMDDDDIEEVRGLPVPGLTFFLGFRATF